MTTTTIKIHERDRQRLKLLAVQHNMTMMDYLSQLLDQQEQQTMTTEKNLTDNAWINRVNELRQMVADLPDAPTSEDDVHYYISSPDFFNSSDFDNADKDFLFAEMRRQYNLPDPY